MQAAISDVVLWCLCPMHGPEWLAFLWARALFVIEEHPSAWLQPRPLTGHINITGRAPEGLNI